MASTANAPLSRLRLSALVVLVLIVAQAGLGIFSLSGHASVNEIHGILGYTNFLVAIAATVFAFQAKKINDSLKGLFMHAMSLPVMAFIQIGIIEAAKGNSGMKWAHVVIGIAYLVSAVGLYMLADKKSHAHR